MIELVYMIFGEELFLSLPPELQALLCFFVFACVMWLGTRLFKVIGGAL